LLAQKTPCFDGDGSRAGANPDGRLQKNYNASMRFSFRALICAVVFLFGTRAAFCDAAFDLDGPVVHATVTRGSQELPISAVPNLLPADKIWLRMDPQPGQAVHYLMIGAFLRNSTNPPPDKWFFKLETWNKSMQKNGAEISVPPGALHMLLLLAPDTGGGFSTVRSAVEGNPGVFVRASRDLYAASLERTRVDAYLNAVQSISVNDPDRLEERSKLLARSLSVKIDINCFDKPVEDQPGCLTKNSGSLILDDGHTQSMVASLTSGTTSDLFNQLSYSHAAGGGAYSPYVGAIVDVVHLMGGMHTADYQYLPALTVDSGDAMQLKLSTPPSFRKPKSVLVVGMPAVQADVLPPLHAVHGENALCLESPKLLLAVDGAPLVFSTEYPRDVHLEVAARSGKPAVLTVRADAERGGFTVEETKANQAVLAALEADASKDQDAALRGHLQGEWGFDAWRGPAFLLEPAHPVHWQPVTETGSAVAGNAFVAGEKAAFDLHAGAAVCVENLTLEDAQQQPVPVTWKPDKPGVLRVEADLENAAAGALALHVQQYALQKADTVPLHVYAQAAQLTGFVLHSGDEQAVLAGTRLGQVRSAELQGIPLVPGVLMQNGAKETLQLSVPAARKQDAEKLAALQPETAATLHVTLQDGRVLNLPVVVQAARPRVRLLSKSVQMDASAQGAIHFSNTDDLPQNGRLTFFLQSVAPEYFSRTEQIEVADMDGSFSITLSVANGGLMLQDPQTVMAVLDPQKSFGSSAFGALQFRAVDGNGVAGDWQPLAHLVRLPVLKDVQCPMDPAAMCMLHGENLFLLSAVGADGKMTQAVQTPSGFDAQEMRVPRPVGAVLYMELRDDPKTVDAIALPVLPAGQ
jgi:hypothetical protein